jgi:hypothetical protein
MSWFYNASGLFWLIERLTSENQTPFNWSGIERIRIMEGHVGLNKQVRQFKEALRDLSDPRGLEEFLKIITRPGWTTPAEQIFVSAILTAMIAHLGALKGLKSGLLKGSQEVGTGGH